MNHSLTPVFLVAALACAPLEPAPEARSEVGAEASQRTDTPWGSYAALGLPGVHAHSRPSVIHAALDGEVAAVLWSGSFGSYEVGVYRESWGLGEAAQVLEGAWKMDAGHGFIVAGTTVYQDSPDGFVVVDDLERFIEHEETVTAVVALSPTDVGLSMIGETLAASRFVVFRRGDQGFEPLQTIAPLGDAYGPRRIDDQLVIDETPHVLWDGLWQQRGARFPGRIYDIRGDQYVGCETVTLIDPPHDPGVGSTWSECFTAELQNGTYGAFEELDAYSHPHFFIDDAVVSLEYRGWVRAVSPTDFALFHVPALDLIAQRASVREGNRVVSWGATADPILLDFTMDMASFPIEVCGDGEDNDLDGFADCEDSECAASDAACACPAEDASEPAAEPVWEATDLVTLTQSIDIFTYAVEPGETLTAQAFPHTLPIENADPLPLELEVWTDVPSVHFEGNLVSTTPMRVAYAYFRDQNYAVEWTNDAAFSREVQLVVSPGDLQCESYDLTVSVEPQTSELP